MLILGGIGGLFFGFYALLLGGKDQTRRGGIGPIPERGIHLVAGVRMLVLGALCLAAGAYVLFELGG